MDEKPPDENEEYTGADTIHKISEVERKQLENKRRIAEMKRKIKSQRNATKPLDPSQLPDHESD